MFALTVVVLAPTAVMASTSGQELVVDSQLKAAAIQERQIDPGSVAGSDQAGSLEGRVILAKGDMSGTGPGAGGQKGQKKGGHKGKQSEGKDNPNKQKGKGKP
jgi:hypothetical protein